MNALEKKQLRAAGVTILRRFTRCPLGQHRKEAGGRLPPPEGGVRYQCKDCYTDLTPARREDRK